MCEAENLALCIDQTVAISNHLSGAERAAKVMAHIGALRYIQWRQWRRRDAPDQVTIESTARACGAATRKLGDGTEPGAGSIADGFGLGKGLVAVATEGLVERTSPHRTARILQPGGRELGFGAAPHLCNHGHTASRHGHRLIAMGWMRCKRTSCSSFSALSPAVSVQRPGRPHATKAVGAGAAATQYKAARKLSRRG